MHTQQLSLFKRENNTGISRGENIPGEVKKFADEIDVQLFQANGLRWLEKREMVKVIQRLRNSGYIT